MARLALINRGLGCRVNYQLDSSVGRQLLLDKNAKSSLYTNAKNFENIKDKAEYVFSGHHPGLGSS